MTPDQDFLHSLPLLDIDEEFRSISEQKSQSERIILAANQRSCDWLQMKWLTHQQQQVAGAIDVYTMHQWLQKALTSRAFDIEIPAVLTANAIKSFVLQETEQTTFSLTNTGGVASQIVEAMRRVSHWQIQPEQLVSADSVEVRLFQQIYSKLLDTCAKKNAIADFQIINWIFAHWNDFWEERPHCIVLFGFDQLTPLEISLLQRLGEEGCDIFNAYPRQDNTIRDRISIASIDDAIEFSACYAHEQSRRNPEQSIAVVIPDLSLRLGQVHSIFSKIFHPAELLPQTTASKPNYNVSAAEPLNTAPAIEFVLWLLNQSPMLTTESIRVIVNSTFINWPANISVDDRDQALSVLHRLRQKGRYRYSVKDLVHFLSIDTENAASKLLIERLQSLKTKPDATSFSQWREELHNWLQLWGWPGDINNEFVVRQRELFWRVVDNLAADAGLLSDTAINWNQLLRQALAAQSYQLPSNRTNIHVLGVLEATGVLFDQMILVGFHQDNWPPVAKPSPFLPMDLQRRLKMPSASAEKEVNYCIQITESLLQGASQIIVVDSCNEGEQSLNASSLFESVAQTDMETFLARHSLPRAIELATDKNDNIPELPYRKWIADTKLTKERIPNQVSTYLLSSYSQCPFKSFATGILGLESNTESELVIPAWLKGQWLHASLELIWTGLRSQQDLLSISVESRRALIERSVADTERKYFTEFRGLPKKLIILQRNRLAETLEQWLQIECRRESFNKVLVEQKRELKIGSLTIRMRIDRIDFVDNDRELILDYKTGHCDLKNWFGDRPHELQMPIYALALLKENPLALAYGQVKTNQLSLQMLPLAQDNNQSKLRYDRVESQQRMVKELRTVIDDEKSIIEYWQATVGKLVDYFCEGNFSVSPKSQSSCNYCQYTSLCRYHLTEDRPMAAEIGIDANMAMDRGIE